MIDSHSFPFGTLTAKPCPVCDRIPKFIRGKSSGMDTGGVVCIIQCKRILRKPHLKIEKRDSTWSGALWCGILLWNKAVDYYNTQSHFN